MVAGGGILEFLSRVLDHLPDPSRQLVRYWGWYSNAARGHRLRQKRETSAQRRTVTDPADAEGKRRRLSWSQLIRKVYEIDPPLCPFCGATMRIAVPPVVSGVAFLIDFASLRRLLGHLGFARPQPEPLAKQLHWREADNAEAGSGEVGRSLLRAPQGTSNPGRQPRIRR